MGVGFADDVRHQQTKVETENGNVQENRYDAEGLRFELLENGRRTSFVYHNGELLHEKGDDNQNQTSYHLGAGIDAFRRGQELSYYHRDEQLSTVFITGRNGEANNSYQYDAFGAGMEATEQFSNRIRYTGQQYDDRTGQYYLRARYYNPVLGRFMQEDTYWGDGLNLYAYCGNNPVVYFDPSGFTALDEGGYYVYGLYDEGSQTPYYIGITNDLTRRRQEHTGTGRLNLTSTEKYPVVGDLIPIESNVTYGEARGYEQYYMDKYGTRTGIIGEDISQENRGNKYNSYNRERTDERAQCYEETYKRKMEEDEEIDINKGGSGCQK